MSNTFTITFRAPTAGLSGHEWYFCLDEKKAFLFKKPNENGSLNLVEKADVIEVQDSIYIKYEYEKTYELAGPKSQREYKLWLAEQILEQEVFDEN